MFASAPFSIEHITPISKGGNDSLENLALACQGCNGHKYTKTTCMDPIGLNEVSLYHPRLDQWEAHFAWNNNFTMLTGLTPVGRATIYCLKLNRNMVVNLRQLLIVFGEHPPKF